MSEAVSVDLIARIREIARSLCTPERYEHIIGVERLAVELSRLYSENTLSASLCAIAHDIYRDTEVGELLRMANRYHLEVSDVELKRPVLLHGKVAALYMKHEYGIEGDVFEAIYWHVSGRTNLPLVGKILMVADMGEESRFFLGANEVRKIAITDLEKSFLNVLRLKMSWSIESRQAILPETVLAWNDCIGGVRYVSD